MAFWLCVCLWFYLAFRLGYSFFRVASSVSCVLGICGPPYPSALGMFCFSIFLAFLYSCLYLTAFLMKLPTSLFILFLFDSLVSVPPRRFLSVNWFTPSFCSLCFSMYLLSWYLGQIRRTCSTSSGIFRLYWSQFGEFMSFYWFIFLFSLVQFILNLVSTTSIGLYLCLVWFHGPISVLIFPNAFVCFFRPIVFHFFCLLLLVLFCWFHLFR